jgi:hypothetical protein
MVLAGLLLIAVGIAALTVFGGRSAAASPWQGSGVAARRGPWGWTPGCALGEISKEQFAALKHDRMGESTHRPWASRFAIWHVRKQVGPGIGEVQECKTRGGGSMRKLIAMVAGGALALLVASTPVLAHGGGQGVDSGRDFGQHVAEHAREGVLGKAHNPGNHQGFSGHAW